MKNKVSVVIPTLGGDCLEETIRILNSGTYLPDEILICIPNDYANKVSLIFFDNVRIIKTPFSGQVAQRAFGFKFVKNDLVLQLDDDIHLDRNCLKNLVEFILEHPESSVGPKFLERSTLKYHSYLYKDTDKFSFLDKISFYILNGKIGYVAGQLSKAGVFMGVPEKPDIWLRMGWLPGGCVLHRKANLILENYYPIKGKAYWEDLFYSDILKSNGITMHRVGTAVSTVDFSNNQYMNFLFFIKEFFKVLKVIKIYSKVSKTPSTRLIIFHFYNTLTLVLRYLSKKNKKYFRLSFNNI